ncbi:helix-turn-helix domain-containing protein [Methanocella sp. MCL-LM]|uniref:helix-turn-helix domain-containing protein n=1 Tax=Methanocella sp. MCL-LM TaxID=3412035 RepID=UPI003C725512
MEIDKKAVDSLTSFGLTEYEAKVYLALATKGVQKASALADVSDIPRPHVYSVIKLLHEKGLIIIIPEKVAKYQAVPIETVLSKLLQDRMESIRSLEAIGKDLTSLISENGNKSDEESGEKVRLYNGRWAIMDLIHKMMGRTTSSFKFITSDRGFVLTAAAYEQDLAGLNKKNITAQFLLPVEKDTIPMVERLSKKATIRHLDSMDRLEMLDPGEQESAFLRVVVVDDSEVLFVRATPGGADESAIWTAQKELAKMISLMFRHMWRNAPDLTSKKAEIDTGRKPEHLTPIYGDVELNGVLRMILSNAQARLRCVISQDQLVYNFNTMIAEIRSKVGKGLKVQMLVSIRNDIGGRGQTLTGKFGDIAATIDTLKALGVEVRHPLEESILRMYMNDEEVVFNLLGESATSSSGGNIGVYTNHYDTIARITEHFDRLWDKSVDASERLSEINRYISKEVMKDGEEGIKKYFDRLSGLNLGHFAIKTSDAENKTITIICTDSAEARLEVKKAANGDICESARNAFRSFGEYVYENTHMACSETKCISRGDPFCEFHLYPAEKDRKAVSNELVKFFESIKSERNKPKV